MTSCCFALLCFALLCGGTGKLAWPIMPEQCRLSTAAHCAQIFALFRPPPPSIPPSHPFRHSHPRPAGTEMAAPLTRFTIPPLVHATIAGHGHRHLYGTQEAEEGMLGPHRQVVLPTSRWRVGSFQRWQGAGREGFFFLKKSKLFAGGGTLEDECCFSLHTHIPGKKKHPFLLHPPLRLGLLRYCTGFRLFFFCQGLSIKREVADSHVVAEPGERRGKGVFIFPRAPESLSDRWMPARRSSSHDTVFAAGVVFVWVLSPAPELPVCHFTRSFSVSRKPRLGYTKLKRAWQRCQRPP